ncbi:tetratricopeptide repeat protein [Pantanalinema rosaneae CENA516]|uniref:tetratricopeptide repeat protein n=1 Tax=Pantanalinema rosaneae TaxID=1620701 RepID=UPI003D6F5840
MSKKWQRNPKKQPVAAETAQSLTPETFQHRLDNLLKQQNYRQALETIKNAHRHQPDLEFTPPEAEIWLLRGQQEFQKQDFKQAETSFRQALALGLAGEPHYWLSRCLLQQHRLDAALELIQTAFEQKTLPKDYAICYLKLLFLKDDVVTVEQLISKHSKRFSAAQLHWARGVLALQTGHTEEAITSFKKIKRPLTPGDLPQAWLVYTQQRAGNWEAASQLLGLRSSLWGGFPVSSPKYLQQPILQQLALFQRATTGEPPLQPSDTMRGDAATQELLTGLAIIQLLERNDPHNAAHALLNLSRRPTQLPELNTLRSALLIRAGQQALEGGEPECSEQFWKPLLNDQPFNPQLAVNLLKALELNESYQEQQRLITRLLKWVEQDAKQHPDQWAGDRLKLTLAQLHCQMADTWVALGRSRTALGAVQQAERICPTSPEVIGRQGLIAFGEKRLEEGARLLTQAVEQGCQSEEVYQALLVVLDDLNQRSTKQEIRRRFGKRFGDLNPEADVEFEPWLEALYSQRYLFFSRLVQTKTNPDWPMQACQIFVKSVQSPPNSGGRVSLNQAEANREWDRLLQGLSGEEQIPTLQAIVLSIHLFAKREKGIAALTNQYILQLFNLGAEIPAARAAHLVVLAVTAKDPKKLEEPLRNYLDTMPQPGNALADIQLQVRRLGWVRNLISYLDAALKQEPQNPLLLLARATSYPFSMPQYEQLKQQGFDIARRIQDAKALQAFREEEAFIQLRHAQSLMPNPEKLDDLDEVGALEALEAMIRRMFGNQIPKAELDRIMPELTRKMIEEMPDFDDDFEDDDLDFDAPFTFGKPKKRKRTFRDL